jgi:hypothetical protein
MLVSLTKDFETLLQARLSDVDFGGKSIRNEAGYAKKDLKTYPVRLPPMLRKWSRS